MNDVTTVCNAPYLDATPPGQYAYGSTTSSPTHAKDTAYLFYDRNLIMVSNAVPAEFLQLCITRFAEKGMLDSLSPAPCMTDENRIIPDIDSPYIGPVDNEQL